ncbi:hypothetical protein P170DRAFT_511190 [Aspergillus steynii IBT 23096]|uniref:Uncharacterized protein n=1 Tax=Aspergillus steynii IBT 23096 TaxID=1392250 RepID=A0A2I2G0P7_9EURO|nr:uncharacterized protein P170DRAFT_511190 [Aspergillus steynii IBT 23096]PLB46416.1 hypothetical protein P170DRAFT_511190 [Aspergillus steynii IBT 23096]
MGDQNVDREFWNASREDAFWMDIHYVMLLFPAASYTPFPLRTSLTSLSYQFLSTINPHKQHQHAHNPYKSQYTDMPPRIAFISGPIDTGPSESYFTHYVRLIDSTIAANDSFVIGPIPYGVDSNALSYLLSYQIDPSRIIIFITPSEDGMWGLQFRGLSVNVHVVDGQTGPERDAAMTAASEYDIMRVWTVDEAGGFYGRMWREGHVTNTERNWKQRRGIHEDVVVPAEDINRDVDMLETVGSAQGGGGGGSGLLKRLFG